MLDPQKPGGPRQVTPLELLGAGGLALLLGAGAGFFSHFVGTAKQLAEDGIDPRTRLRFLPIAAKALAASSAVCAGLGVVAVGGWKLAGLQYKEIAEVSSWDDALALAKQQREVVQQLFKQQLSGPPDERPQPQQQPQPQQYQQQQGGGPAARAAAAAAKPPARAAKGRRQAVDESSESESEEPTSSSSSSSSSSSEEESEVEQYEPPARRGRRPAAAAKAAAAPRKRGRPPGKAAGRAGAAAVGDEDEEATVPKKRAKKGPGHIDQPTPVEGGWMLDPHTPLIYRDVGFSGSRVAAFTLDGTICVTKMGLPYAGSATDWMFTYPGVPQRLAQLQQEGYLLVIMNNQGNVKAALNGKASANARGKVDAILDNLAMHGVDGTQVKVLLAPSMDALRKPDPGMWHFLANKLNSGVAIDVSKSFYVGDSDGDAGFASALGLRCFRPASFFKGSSSGGGAAAAPVPGEVRLNAGLVDMFRQMEEAYVARGEPAAKLAALRQAKQIIASTAFEIRSSADLQGVRGIGKVTSSWIDEYCRYGHVQYLGDLQEEMCDWF
ncbi:Bifunctional polynucleotide phosphatase kinase [Chlorella sorokiniana]|uniref:Bifunctional polynucleotide phosphatase kinase n=1 Tax=Chlorella sorokiniana TaxID=3076 RepID=A0A2P6TLQ1_CHLSO|nr:Bifunctional polynucleotide phosphatase kinase [Chlorella sorokiniana]|eukprot:PRW45221.1 Bifunctional polynucleotide phosphatase kinase [Chlorella sorokiniana]